MSPLNRELVFLILQFLEEERFTETVHKLEKDSGFFFNMRYFEDAVTNGEWEEVEKYLRGFTRVDDNRYSMKIYFEIRKQKYLEALDKRDHARAVEILSKDLKAFSTFNEDLFKEITMLLTLPNFRENEQLSKYSDAKSARSIMLVELRKLIEANPRFHDKLQFPTFNNSRLRTLINQSLNWQHQLCKYPKPNPDMKTLFVDHSCGQGNVARAPLTITNPLMGPIPNVGFPPIGGPGPFQHGPPPLTASPAGWMPNPSSVPRRTISVGPMGLTPPNNADSEHVVKRSRPFAIQEEVNNPPVSISPLMYPGQSHAHFMHSADDLPKTVVANLNQGSVVKSMDFHPTHQTLLLVGTNVGEISIWEVSKVERIVVRSFKAWNLGACSVTLQASLANGHTASVNRVMWSPDGKLLGVAYSKHIVDLYAYLGGDDLRSHRQIEAHIGSVNDLAFSHPNEKLCIISCGEDKTIKVWDAATGARQYTFEGHEAPVYSLCTHQKQNIQFIFSTSVDGRIKAWLYDNMGSRVDYDAPGRSCTTLAYSADGTRLFSCGTSKDGESYIVEWNESEGTLKRTYVGLGKGSVGVVQFDTAKNHYLAAGDQYNIKFWDMDNVNVLLSIDADGGLPASPCIRFSKEGALMAVSTSDNGIKILANAEGIKLMRCTENGAGATSKAPVGGTFGASGSSAAGSSVIADRSSPMGRVTTLNGDSRNLPDIQPRISEELDESKMWKLTEINDQSQLRSLRLPDSLLAVRISRLIYTNSGSSILALAYNAVHKLWRWQRSERNASGKATTDVPPQLWQPSSGILMTNDISETNPEEAVPCFALSKNDSYMMSASGGKISLFNMMTFKTMTTFKPPPPAATYLAFHPQDNNVVAIGMEDAVIQIYNVRMDEARVKVKAHHKRITGLAFSSALNILVSSCAGAEISVWDIEQWRRKTFGSLRIPVGRGSTSHGQTRVQFHQDQTHMLIVHETQLAIYVPTPKLELVTQWVPRDPSPAITDATYSCDSQSIFSCFEDGSVLIFTAVGLKMKCRINPAAYIPSSPRLKVHPLAIAAHPSEPNQFALGLADGGVHVLEPLESEGKWGTAPPEENDGVGSSNTTPAAAATGSDQASR